MDNMTITNAQYCQGSNGVNSCIKATIDGTELFVPLKTDNSHYAEILKQVDAGTLTIQEAN